MPEPISAIPNLGPATEAAFAKAGVHSAEDLRQIGADEGYRRLLLAGTGPHFIGYYVLVMGLQGRPWNDCKGAEKAALRVRFDAIKASVTGADSQISAKREAELRFFGVIAAQAAG